MEQSFYSQYVEKFFPQLVISLVEKLNGKHVNQLSYLFKNLLKPEFAPDGRWSSVIAEYNRVAADVVALDSELPLKSRDTISIAQGDIPKLGMKLYLTEKQMKDIDNMIAQGLPVGRIIEKIFNDVPRVIEGIYERLEDLFLSELSTGVALSANNNGTGVRIDVGYLAANQFSTIGATWASNPTTCTPLDDLQAIFDKAISDSNTITDIWMDDYALNAFYKSQQVREQYAFNSGVTVHAGANVPVLDQEKAAAVIATKWGVTLHRVARKVKTEINGVRTNHTPYQEGMVVLTCNEMLGSLVWTMCAEATRPVAQVAYQTADEYILVSKYATNDPLREFTASQAMVIPVLDNVDQIYTLNSKQQAV